MSEELLERLDFIEFRQELLFDNSPFSRHLFEGKVTRQQYSDILDLFDSLRESIDGGNEISSVHYESEISRIVPQREHDYHWLFAI